MQEPKHWLAFAQTDLLAAKSLTRDGYFSPASYHCQQCAEKALKGFLIAHEADLLKTHDLIKLLGLCKKIDPDFNCLENACSVLTVLATQFRYPSEFEIPDETDCLRFIDLAREVFDFVISKSNHL
ncbi:MAG TPA: HEPN domain-containing protein [Candidatus Dependentiae bacterium]|jgi:HEPN domain-containing protein|nr:HEPN domain-containing protein [Candidatus Dependentiae bacterium]